MGRDVDADEGRGGRSDGRADAEDRGCANGIDTNEGDDPPRAVLRAMPGGLPWAIEYPLAGDDLLAVTRREVEQLRAVARSLS